jgi:dolichol-phosphate mannosyltransferase
VKLTIVIPTYNEAENLPGLASALFALPIETLHLLIVDDNSPDGTGQLAEALAQDHPGRMQVLHRSGKLGLASAYIQGFGIALGAGASAIAQMDADFSHPPNLLPVMLKKLENHDLVIGSRYIAGGGVDREWPAWRKLLSGFGNLYARTILRVPVRDITGGYRLWRREGLEKIPFNAIRSDGYAFQVEMLYLAYRLGLSFTELPFYFADRTSGQSKMSLRIQREAALRVWQMRFTYRNLKRG